MPNTPAIYFIYHQTTNSIYIGECLNYEKRNGEEKRALRKKCFHNKSLQILYNSYDSKSFIYGILQHSTRNKAILKNLEKYYMEQFSICCNILNRQKGAYDIELIKPHLNDPYSLFIKNFFQKVYPSMQTSNVPFISTPITIHRLQQEFLISLVLVLSDKYDPDDIFKTMFNIDLNLCNDALFQLFLYFPNYFILKFIKEYCNSYNLFLRHDSYNNNNYNRSTQKPFFSLDFEHFFSLCQNHISIYSSSWRNILSTAISDLNNVYLEKFPIPKDFMDFLNLSEKYNYYISSYTSSLNYAISRTNEILCFLHSTDTLINPIKIDAYNNVEENIILAIKSLEKNLTLFYGKKFFSRYKVENFMNDYYPVVETSNHDFSKSIPLDWILELDSAIDFNKYF